MRFPHGTISKVAAAFMLCTLVFVNLTAAQFKSDVETEKKIRVPETQLMTALGPFRFGSDPFLPTYTNGNPSCVTLDDLDNVEATPPTSDANFEHMSSGWEFRLNFTSPNSTFPIINSANPETIVSGGSANPNMSINVVSSGSTMISWQLNWNSAAIVDRLVSAVIIKGGSNANVYTYPDLSSGDTGTFQTPFQSNSRPEISHISFCFEPFSGPSSAPVALSGRVLTSTGDGIAYTRVDVVSLSTGEVYSAMTNNFGYYTVADLAAEETYMVTASHRRHTFINNQRTVTTTEDLFGVDFVAP